MTNSELTACCVSAKRGRAITSLEQLYSDDRFHHMSCRKTGEATLAALVRLIEWEQVEYAGEV